MDRKLVVICVLAVVLAVMVISGCTSGPAANTTITPKPGNVTLMPSASPGTYAGAGGFAQNASGNASVAPSPGVTPSGVPAGVIGSNNTTAKK